MKHKGFALVPLFFLCRYVLATDLVMPLGEHYKALNRGRDCAIFRTLFKESRKKITNWQKAMKVHMAALRKARVQLLSCAEDKGLVEPEAKGREILMAELCPRQYRAWLDPSYRVQMVAEDLRSAYQTARITEAQIEDLCPSLPPARVPASETPERRASNKKGTQEIEESEVEYPNDGYEDWDEDPEYMYVEIAKHRLGGL